MWIAWDRALSDHAACRAAYVAYNVLLGAPNTRLGRGASTNDTVVVTSLA